MSDAVLLVAGHPVDLESVTYNASLNYGRFFGHPEVPYEPAKPPPTARRRGIQEMRSCARQVEPRLL